MYHGLNIVTTTKTLSRHKGRFDTAPVLVGGINNEDLIRYDNNLE